MVTLVISVLVGNLILQIVLGILNQKNMLKPWPKEVRGIYTIAQVKRAVEYSKENFQFSITSKFVSTILMILMITEGGFNLVNNWAITFSENESVQALFFMGTIIGANQIIAIPFSYYSTFVIEEKFGFNTTTKKLFIIDTIKGLLLGGLIGGGLLYLLGFLIEIMGSDFWLIFWGVIVVIMVFVNTFYTSLLLPIFNKLSEIKDEELKSCIYEYCQKVGYKLSNLFQMDGSKRSKKANAFFSGMGPKKTIVLYDTLIEGQSKEEIVAVLAHEIGHYKKKHTLFNLIFGIVQMFLILFLLGWAINQEELSLGLDVEVSTFYTGLIAFFILLSPITILIGVFQNIISRKMEYQADAYARDTYDGEKLIDALKKLSVDNLSNLNPHPAYVFVNYSHPPIHERIKAIRN
ncbi:MAG: peptidase M48 [Flavobacteriales bacterium]|nr:peptidase M48 [Flavobacteriales bacterium]|tara:strand:+ start:681 stop:1898 length:1218 start_codon:yes stop_codon:yes gene_type:complete